MDLGLSGRRVLITGASRGIGAAAAAAFANEGCRLFLTASNEKKLFEVAEQLRRHLKVDVEAEAFDLEDPQSVERITHRCGAVDVLINNAGGIPPGTLFDVGETDWERAWRVKVFGFINLTRTIYPRMKAQGGGVIINNIGIAGEKPEAGYICGSTANAALIAFTRGLGGKSMNDRVRVIGVNPGGVETERQQHLLGHRSMREFGTSDRIDELKARMPGGRLGKPEEVADLMVFLASDRASYVSGTVVTIDGGLSAGFKS